MVFKTKGVVMRVVVFKVSVKTSLGVVVCGSLGDV